MLSAFAGRCETEGAPAAAQDVVEALWDGWRIPAWAGFTVLAFGLTASSQTPQRIDATPTELRQIVKDAYVYGFPMVDSYRIQYSYFVDTAHPEYKGPWNQPHSVARVYTPRDTAIQTPNSDTPYTFLGADLRAEPLVISVPAIATDRYYSLQFIDMYTHNFAYVGSRATGSEAGHYLLAGPGWKGTPPVGITSVIRSETEFAFVLYRTQLFGTSDLEEVKKIQTQYVVRTLSQFANAAAPPLAPPAGFVKPLSPDAQKTSPEFFAILNFLLRFAPTHPSETALMKRFARAGIGPGHRFDVAVMSAEQRQAVTEGMADAWATFARFKSEEVDTGKRTSADGFGTREFLKNDYLGRMSSAVLGIYGNSKEEANYPVYFVDSERNPLNGATHRYTVRFGPGQLPPVNAFWSLTMYELPSSLLTDNPIDRYLINSQMEPDLIRDPDGGITLYVQHESPGKEKGPNWLPAPKGPFYMVLREYWPRREALNGSWTPPQPVRAR